MTQDRKVEIVPNPNVVFVEVRVRPSWLERFSIVAVTACAAFILGAWLF